MLTFAIIAVSFSLQNSVTNLPCQPGSMQLTHLQIFSFKSFVYFQSSSRKGWPLNSLFLELLLSFYPESPEDSSPYCRSQWITRALAGGGTEVLVKHQRMLVSHRRPVHIPVWSLPWTCKVKAHSSAIMLRYK